MSTNMEAFLENIVSEYSMKRSEKQKEYWFTCKSWIKRVFNNKAEYSLLLTKEPEFLNSYKDWFLKEYTKLHNLKAEDLGKASIYLKSFKDRLSHRSGFLVIMAAVIAILSSIGAAIHRPEWLFVNIATGLLVILERHHLNEKAATIQELIYIIELATNNANQSKQ